MESIATIVVFEPSGSCRPLPTSEALQASVSQYQKWNRWVNMNISYRIVIVLISISGLLLRCEYKNVKFFRDHAVVGLTVPFVAIMCPSAFGIPLGSNQNRPKCWAAAISKCKRKTGRVLKQLRLFQLLAHLHQCTSLNSDIRTFLTALQTTGIYLPSAILWWSWSQPPRGLFSLGQW